MLAEGIRWENVEPLLQELKASGIEANITVGAIRLNPKESEKELASNICKKYGAIEVHDGKTSTLAAMTIMADAERTGRKIDIDEMR